MFNRLGSVVGAIVLAVCLPSLASAYCGVRINGKWMYSGGNCADWNSYAKNSGDNGFACFNFGVADTITRESPTSVLISTPSGRRLPLASDAMQRAFNRVARQSLSAQPPRRIVIRDDHGVISRKRLVRISRETGAKIVSVRPRRAKLRAKR